MCWRLQPGTHQAMLQANLSWSLGALINEKKGWSFPSGPKPFKINDPVTSFSCSKAERPWAESAKPGRSGWLVVRIREVKLAWFSLIPCLFWCNYMRAVLQPHLMMKNSKMGIWNYIFLAWRSICSFSTNPQRNNANYMFSHRNIDHDPKFLAHYPSFCWERVLLNHQPWCLICGHGGTPYSPRLGMETYCGEGSQGALHALPVEPRL